MEGIKALLPIIGIVVLFVIIIVGVLSTWKRIPSDKAAVIVGVGEPKVVTGCGVIVIPILQRADIITLENIMFDVVVERTKTSLGVPINTQGVVVIKVKNDSDSIKAAVQQFNCSSEKDTVAKITNVVSEICKGKLREIVSSMSVEEIYGDRESFASNVLKVVSKELGEMGIELKSFTINDITDNDEYIESLGKAQIAKVKSDAAIEEARSSKNREIQIAEANREQLEATSEANRIGCKAELESEAEIERSKKEKELKVLEYTKETQTQKAISDAAYKIQESITKKEVTNAEMDASVLEETRRMEVTEAKIQVDIAAEQKNIELAKRKAERKQAELEETQVKPAEADKRVKELEAEADKFTTVKKAEADAESVRQMAQADSESIRQIGEAEADAIRSKGLAEAEALNKKAEALSKMNEAGKLQMVIDKLPEIVEALVKPMEKIGNITIIGGDGKSGTDSVAGIGIGALKCVTEALKDTIGFDLTEVMKSKTISAKTDRNIAIDVKGGVANSENLVNEVLEGIVFDEVTDNETSVNELDIEDNEK